MDYFYYAAVAFGIAAVLTPAVAWLARHLHAVDVPGGRHKHEKPTPLLGGWALFGAFVLTTGGYLLWGDPNLITVPPRFFGGLLFGGSILMLGGYLDDRYNLPPKFAFVAPAAAAVVAIASGIGVGITELSNPFGAPVHIGVHLGALPVSALVMFVWIMGMTYTTKFLDGLDGLCTGVSAIAGLTLLLLSLTPRIDQPVTATLAAIFVGCCLGFLIHNWHRASIFLGESGSTITGFLLATLSVILGGKIATAFLVMGVPILDVAWAIVRRIWFGQSPFSGDRGHLHYRLVDLGLSQRQAVLVLYACSAVFGISAVFLQSKGKLVALGLLALVTTALAVGAVLLYKRKTGKSAQNQGLTTAAR